LRRGRKNNQTRGPRPSRGSTKENLGEGHLRRKGPASREVGKKKRTGDTVAWRNPAGRGEKKISQGRGGSPRGRMAILQHMGDTYEVGKLNRSEKDRRREVVWKNRHRKTPSRRGSKQLKRQSRRGRLKHRKGYERRRGRETLPKEHACPPIGGK